MKWLAVLIMRGRWSAVWIAATAAVLFWLFPPILMVSGAAVALVTLRRGVAEGGLLLILAGLGATGLVWLALDNPWPMLNVLLAYCLPLWLLAWMLRITVSLSTTFQAAALVSLLAVAGFYLVLGDPAIWWVSALDQWQLNLTALVSSGQVADQATLEQLLTLLRQWAPLLPGQAVSATLLFVLLALLLGRWWQAVLFNPEGFRPEFHQLRLGRLLAIFTLALFGAAIASGWPLLSNFILVLGMLYTVQGVAVVHAVAFKWQLAPTWLLLFYLLLIPLLSQWVMVLGFADAWLDFRNRVRPRWNKP